MTKINIKNFIEPVSDFPKAGINFLDISPLLANPKAYDYAIDLMANHLQAIEFDTLVAIDARGFLFGASLMQKLNKPLALIRKAGKLPGSVSRQMYELEYGQASIELQNKRIQAGDKVVLVDDVLATGGTIKAACQLVEQLQGEVVCISALVALNYLPYQQLLENYSIHSVVHYDN